METTSSPAPSTPEAPSRRPRRHRGRRGFLAGLVLGALGAGLAGFAVGATMPVAEAAHGVMSAMGHGGCSHDGAPSPEKVKEHAGVFLGFALHRLDATDDQEVRVQEIVGQAIDDVFPLVEAHRANRDELRSILAGPVVDRAAIEALRAEEMALADTLSRTLAVTIADAAEVLTLEQRTELVEDLGRFHHRH